MIEEGLPTDQYIKDEFFQRWVYQPDRDTDLYWEEFLRNNPGQKHAITEARIFLLVFGNHTEDVSPNRVNELTNRIDVSINTLEGTDAGASGPQSIMRIQSEKQARPHGWIDRLVSAFPKWFKQ